MQVEVGSIVEGKITGITNFGAFVAFGAGQTGMVHISEISNSYVKEIGDFLSDNQEVKVKILSISDDGKISLSIKQCEPIEPNGNNSSNSKGPVKEKPFSRPPSNRRNSSPKDIVWQPKPQDSFDDLSFEDMMTKFKQVSNDRMGELKRASDPRRTKKTTSR